VSPLSPDPDAREAQLANLRQGGAPPAPEGNDRRRTHGGYASVSVDQLAPIEREIRDALAADAPVDSTADAAMIGLAASALYRWRQVAEWLDKNGAVQARKGPRFNVIDLEGRLRREAADHLAALGMSPRARARMGVDVARGRALQAGADGVAGLDLTRLTDDELAAFRRIQAKARGDVEGEATTA